jgi:ribosomal protein S18 acetylase RimI-like enzyme
MDHIIDFQQLDRSSTDDVAYVRRKFIEFNDSQSGVFESKELHLIAYGSEQQVIGGLLGDISWGWLHVDVLWVDEAYRKYGIGTALMDRAEAEAGAMDVRNAYIETTDFQALGFYEKRGYKIFAHLDNQPPGHVCYYMKKTTSSK